MSELSEEELALERAVAARQHEKEQQGAPDGGLVGDVKNVVEHPGDAAEAVVRKSAKLAAIGVFRGIRAVVKGVAEARDGIEKKPSSAALVAPSAAETPPKLGWFEEKRAKLDAAVADLANSKAPLRRRAFIFSMRKAFAYWHWAGTTYPYVLRPVSWVAHKMRDRIDAKVKRKGGVISDWQMLKARLLSIGPSHGVLARSRYRMINTAALFLAVSLALDGGWSYGTYEQYNDVVISHVFRNPDNTKYVSEVHGYQIRPDGTRATTFFEVRHSLFYGVFYPQYIVSGISDGDVCHISTWGTSQSFPITARKFFTLNPSIISVHCVTPGKQASAQQRSDLQAPHSTRLQQTAQIGAWDYFRSAQVKLHNSGLTPKL